MEGYESREARQAALEVKPEPRGGFHDLRDFISQVESMGDLQVVNGADWDQEIGALTEVVAEHKEHPVLLFDNIKGYPPGYRVLTNPLTTVRRVCLALGLPLDTKPLDILKVWKDKSANFQPVPPIMVKDAPVKENVVTGKDVDLFKFPVPKWHDQDPSRYMGTADCVLMRDPDAGWVNLATYRMALHDKDTLGLYISPGKHGYLFLQRYHERGESAPIAVSFGHDPLLFLTCATFFPYQNSEYEYAGWLRGKPYEVTRGVTTDLPIPATAEIVIEGEVPPRSVETRTEGPFGEFTGYYSVGPHPQMVVKVKSIMFRNNPILLGAPPFRFPIHWFSAIPFNAAETWDALDKAGVPDVKGVWQFGSWFPFLTVVAIRQRYAGHAKQAALVAMGAKGSAYCGRLMVVVDDDIDITSLEDVVWAITTRCEPANSIDLIRECWSSPIDPIISPEMRFGLPHGAQHASRLIINACRPYTWLKDFPKVNAASPELKEKMRTKYADLMALLKG